MMTFISPDDGSAEIVVECETRATLGFTDIASGPLWIEVPSSQQSSKKNSLKSNILDPEHHRASLISIMFHNIICITCFACAKVETRCLSMRAPCTGFVQPLLSDTLIQSSFNLLVQFSSNISTFRPRKSSLGVSLDYSLSGECSQTIFLFLPFFFLCRFMQVGRLLASNESS